MERGDPFSADSHPGGRRSVSTPGSGSGSIARPSALGAVFLLVRVDRRPEPAAPRDVLRRGPHGPDEPRDPARRPAGLLLGPAVPRSGRRVPCRRAPSVSSVRPRLRSGWGSAWVSVLWVWAGWRIGRRIAGDEMGTPGRAPGRRCRPIFLTFMQLSSTTPRAWRWRSGTVTLATAMRLVDPLPGQRRGLGLGAAGADRRAGIGGQARSATMLIGAAALGLLVARPGVLAGPGPYAALGLFGLASLPFWVWNVQHEWATFRAPPRVGRARCPHFAGRIQNVAGARSQARSATPTGTRRAVPLPPCGQQAGLDRRRRRVRAGDRARRVAPRRLGPACSLTGIGPGASPSTWSSWRSGSPWRSQLLTWFGTSGVIRYSLTFFGPLPLLVAAGPGAPARASGAPVAARRSRWLER